jgi:Mg2+ and Co2+ transporter CorA
MNFIHLPWLRSPYGTTISLSIMAAVTVALLVVFRRLRWW